MPQKSEFQITCSSYEGLRDQHKMSGPGKPRNWSLSESGDWVKISDNGKKEPEKRKANGSPDDQAKSKKDSSGKTTPPKRN